MLIVFALPLAFGRGLGRVAVSKALWLNIVVTTNGRRTIGVGIGGPHTQVSGTIGRQGLGATIIRASQPPLLQIITRRLRGTVL